MSFRDTDPSPGTAVSSPIGERIPLKNGITLEKPSIEVLARLMDADSRVRYFETPSPDRAGQERPGYAYYRAIAEPLGLQVREDFGDEPIAIRGTTAALEHSFPYWPDQTGHHEATLNDVLTILRSGSDDGQDQARVGFMTDEGEMNVETTEHLFTHWFGTHIELKDTPEGEQVFPVLIVYRPEAFEKLPVHGCNTFAGKPSERIAAIYITDRTEL
jgi:hypothetical protein